MPRDDGHPTDKAPKPTLPLRVGPGSRYLVDQRGVPFLVQGDTAWSILASVSEEDASRYLDDRAAKGFNAVIVNVIERLFAPDPPRTVDGLEPFIVPGDLSTPNDAYFDHVDRVLQIAAERGIVLFLAPAYLGYKNPAYPGYNGQPEGWFAELLEAGVERCGAYGEYLGRRFGAAPNIVWVMAGDRRPGKALDHIRAIAAGLRAGGARQLMTAHVEPEFSPIDEFEGDPWLELNQTYSYEIVHRHLRADYERRPTRPFVLFESTYEGEHNASTLQIRRQAWWAILSGACGQFLGSYPIWLMPPGWEGALDSVGAIAMAHLAAIVRPRPWWDLVPDFDHRLVVGGLGEFRGLDYCAAASTPDGRLAIAYMPTPRPIEVDLSLLPTGPIRATWIDPATGRSDDGEIHAGKDARVFMPPGPDDAVLLLEAADPGGPARSIGRRAPAGRTRSASVRRRDRRGRGGR